MAETVVPDLTAPPARVGRDRHRGLELLRATEAAALSVGRWLGRGDKSGTRDAGQLVMEEALVGMPFDGRVVIGPEGGNSNLAPGRRIGVGRDRVDLAIIPVDGLSLVSRGLSQALSIAAAAEPGGILSPPPVAYMHKIAVGPAARGAVDIADTPENNLRRIAFAMDVQVQDLTVIMLDRPRHQTLLERVRSLGIRVALISDGDVGAAMMAAWPGSGIDVMIGSGGTQEAIVAACAMRCLGGELHCRPWVRHEDEAVAVRAAGLDPEQTITMEQLVPGRQVSIAVTGISGGGMLRGVQYHNWWAETHSLVMRAQSGTVREIRTKHHVALPPEGARRVR
ncbi:MAG: fructose-bisphosphatase class II family protein [Candidatus Dormibacteraeota bacterium]|uniref:Fructose-1,6-bisphosphatase n=1 Tax=Candidatus Aeolococcus gillhamiae TaxID=3127015 RepID=A0A2W5ZK27_9BACT|nr:fructose-bisphosphatase class II family protein [Candidatus Dormibacteraeota bacterium]PZR83196.1 MAG: fructose-bisphosphatase class II [Candidatus Dormibacter sp. RRmetagenome_bin12]